MKLKLIILITATMLVQNCCLAGAFWNQRNSHIWKDGASQNLNRANAVALKLFDVQNFNDDLWQRAGWWNSANILEALIDLNRITHQNFTACLAELYKKNVHARAGNFITVKSFDDNEWWALTWLKAYDMTGDARYSYINIADGIFKDMINRSWDTICNGGMRWAANGEYKNAVTNELFIELAVRLALEPADSARKDYYLGWAIKDWNWLLNSGMINSEQMINDGLGDNCENNKGFTWTYNQGVILGALKGLYMATGDNAYLEEAKKLANASMQNLANNEGVLTEPGGSDPNPDKVQFKGIYVRYLAELNTILKDESIKKFILLNANYAWVKAQSSDNLIDYNWSGPFNEWSSSAQGSALDLMNAALMEEQ